MNCYFCQNPIKQQDKNSRTQSCDICTSKHNLHAVYSSEYEGITYCSIYLEKTPPLVVSGYVNFFNRGLTLPGIYYQFHFNTKENKTILRRTIGDSWDDLVTIPNINTIRPENAREKLKTYLTLL